MKKRRKLRLKWERLAVLALVVVLAAGICIWGAFAVVGKVASVFSRKDDTQTVQEDKTADGQNTEDAAASSDGEVKSLTFAGVGDNLLHDVIFVYYEEDTGTRDFTPLYEPIKPYVEDADLAYINFETICAGDAYGLSGYPAFNGPSEFIDALVDTGFDWFSTSSNHSMDYSVSALADEMDYIETNYPDVLYTGTHSSSQAADTPLVKEINGIKVGFAGFTYGLNGIQVPEGYDWIVDVFQDNTGAVDYDLIDSRIDALQDVSDVQIVSMHWGEEYANYPSEVQQEVAAYLNSKGVEVIIGTHPHVIQPVEMITGEDGQETLCYYSLGNFISAQNTSERMVGGLAGFTLNYDPATKTTTFTDVTFTPTVTWISPNGRYYTTYAIQDYDNELAASHELQLYYGEDMSKEWVQQYVAEVMGEPEGIEIVYE